MTLEISEFVRRFLLHVLPHRFVKIRYYGLLAQSQRATALRQCRDLLAERQNTTATPGATDPNDGDVVDRDARSELEVCPNCHRGRLVYERALPAIDSSAHDADPLIWDPLRDHEPTLLRRPALDTLLRWRTDTVRSMFAILVYLRRVDSARFLRRSSSSNPLSA
jgi:hypothetical protein